MRAAPRKATGLLFATVLFLTAGPSCGGGGELPTQPGGGGALVTQISISPDGGSVVAGQTLTLAAQPKDASGNPVNQGVTWSSSDGTVAMVAAGVVTALRPGTTAVTATNGVVSKSVNVTVIPAIADVVVTPSPANIIITQTAQLTATPRDAAGAVITGRSVTWTSGNDAIASVSATGLVTAKTLGTTTISAAAEGKTGAATIVVVQIPVASVTITPLASPLTVGDSRQLTASTKDSIGGTLGRPVTWTSSDNAVATVSANGIVHALTLGSTTITAASEGKTGTLVVTVTPRQVASVVVSPATITVAAGKTTQLTATIADANGQPLSGHAVTWTTSDAAKATVNASGLVSALSAGPVTITATSEGTTGQSSVSVIDLGAPNVVGLSVNRTSVDVSAGRDSIVVSVVVKDAGGAGVQRVDIAAQSPTSNVSSCSAPTPATGTVYDGTFKCSIVIPKMGPTGNWTLSVVAVDGALNQRRLSTADVATLGGVSQFTVTSTAVDNTPPVLASLDITPSIVDVSGGGKTVTATAHLTDSQSGVVRFDFRLTSPTGSSAVDCSATAPEPGGTAADGQWQCMVTIPAGAPQGDWSVSAGVGDAAFNNQFGALPGHVTVTNSAPDTDAPVFTSLSVDPSVVDLRTGAKVLTVTAHVTDVGTGVDRLDFRGVATDGTLAECSATTLTSGTPQNGTWVCQVTIPPSVTGGDWQIFVRATDKALNVRAPTQSEMPTFGPTKFTVIAP
jgi:uncharacterized protein YjdB